MSTHPSSLRSLWLPILIGLGWLGVCYYLILVFTAPDPVPDGPAAVADQASAQNEPPAEAHGSTLSARLEIRDGRAERTTGWIDLAVTGNADEALAACRALVKREHGRTYPDPLSIVPSVPCQPGGLPDQPDGIGAGVDLVQPTPLSRLDVALAGGGRAESLFRLRSVTVAHYDDRAACEGALAALTAHNSKAAGRALLDANALLDDQIATWRGRVEEACRTGGSERECGTDRALLARLESRRLDPPADDWSGDSAPYCRAVQAP